MVVPWRDSDCTCRRRITSFSPTFDSGLILIDGCRRVVNVRLRIPHVQGIRRPSARRCRGSGARREKNGGMR